MEHDKEMTPPALASARHLVSSGKLAEAERILRQAIDRGRADPALLHGLAIVLMEQQRPADAIIWCDEAVTASPDNPAYCRTLGHAYWQDQQPMQAIAAWHTSLYIQPLQPEVMLLLATAYRAIDDLYAAMDYYRQVLEVQPGNGRAHHLLACSYSDAGLLEDARRHFRQATARLPYQLSLLRAHAENALVLADYDECREVLDSARAYYPKAICLAHLQGLLYFRTDRFDAALDTYEMALGLEPDNQNLLLDYAVCLRTLGDDTSAEKVLRKVREISERQG